MNYKKLLIVLLLYISICQTKSPTQSFLNFIDKKTIEEAFWGPAAKRPERYKDESYAKYEPVVKEVLKVEQKLGNNYYFFYNAFLPDFYILQETYKALICILQTICWTDFEYLRSKDELYKPLKNIDEFFAYLSTLPQRGDENPELKTKLLAVNLSFPGNLEHAESTFFYFTEPTAQIPSPVYESRYETFLRATIEEAIQPTKLPDNVIKSFIDKLKAVRKNFERIKTGFLLQIAIPKKLVDKYVYLSSDYGYPYGRQEYEKDLIEAFKELWSEEKQRFIKISPILEAYQDDPSKIGQETIKQLQARIILSKDLFESPDSGVKMFKHHMIPNSVIKNVQQQIVAIAQSIAQEVIKARAHSILRK